MPPSTVLATTVTVVMSQVEGTTVVVGATTVPGTTVLGTTVLAVTETYTKAVAATGGAKKGEAGGVVVVPRGGFVAGVVGVGVAMGVVLGL